MTASMTPCVTTARSWICEPTPAHTSEDCTSNDTLCDSPVFGSANPNPYTPDDTSNDTLSDSPVLDLRTLTPTHTKRHLQRHPVTTPCVTASAARNPQNLRTLIPQLEVRTPIAKAIWGKKKTPRSTTPYLGGKRIPTQTPLRIKAGAHRVEIQLADGDTHAPSPQISKAQNATAIWEDDAVA